MHQRQSRHIHMHTQKQPPAHTMKKKKGRQREKEHITVIFLIAWGRVIAMFYRMGVLRIIE